MNLLNKNNLLIAGFHYSIHSKDSGYDALVRFLPSTFVDANKFLFSKSKIGTNKRRINMLAFELYVKMIQSQYKLIHYIYPEQQFPFSIPKTKRIKSVATFHLDTDYWAKRNRADYATLEKFLISRFRQHYYQNLDGIITLTRSDVSKFEALFPKAKVQFIPHGVFDKKEFIKHEHHSNELEMNIIIIGTSYRDYDLCKKIISYAQVHKKAWKFHLVSLPKTLKQHFSEFKNTTIYPYLNEDKYFELFSSCHIHFLPLTFATANNALLEAHALGIPSLVSNLPALRDYSVRSTQVFRDDIEAIRLLCDFENTPPSKLNQLRQETLEDAQNFYWKNISAQILDFYQELLG